MRKFSKHENQIIKLLVETKSKGIDAIQSLQTAKILREKFDFFALKWNVGENPSISVYYRHTEEEANKIKYNSLYFQVADFIYFIKELEILGFIAIQTISKKQKREFNLLYDRSKFTYDEKEDRFDPINENPIDTAEMLGKSLPFQEISPGVYALFQVDKSEINLDFANDLERYGLGIIYPLPLAEDYVNNDFKTLEQLQYDTEIATALDAADSGRKAAKYAIASFVIAILTFGYTIYNNNSQSSTEEKALERLESTIKSNHLAEPIKVITSDTITVRQVQTQPANKPDVSEAGEPVSVQQAQMQPINKSK